jgi:uncharacterized FlaG/YvyC family protein
MTPDAITPIRPPDLESKDRFPQAAPVQAQRTDRPDPAATSRAVEEDKDAHNKASTTQASQPANQSLFQMADIRLRFQVDPKTNDVTVFLINRETHNVVRTIPAQELKDMPQGRLFEFFA